MGMMVTNNAITLQILNIMNRNSAAMAKSMQRIASGSRLNSAADDPSAYSIAAKMRIEIGALNQAKANAQSGISMLKTAGGAVDSTVDILARIKEITLTAADDSCSNADRRILQQELDQLVDQINDNANVSFNGRTLMDGSLRHKVTTPTANVFTNEELATDTVGTSLLTELKDRDGNGLDIKDSDTINVSFVKNGQTYTTSFAAGGATLEDIFSKANAVSPGSFGNLSTSSEIGVDASGVSVYSADGSPVVSIGAGSGGLEDAIAGFTISVSGVDGNIKKNINQKLDAFSETIKAANKSGDNALTFQVGTRANQTIRVGLGDMRAQALGLQGHDPVTGTVQNLNVTTRESANAAIDVVDKAIQRAVEQQAKIGSAQSRLEYTIDNLTTSAENLTAAESVISDADIAKEMLSFTKHSILMQAAQAMLAQANQASMSVLNLLP